MFMLSVVIPIAALVSASRIWGTSGPLSPATVTCSTLTNDELRYQSQPTQMTRASTRTSTSVCNERSAPWQQARHRGAALTDPAAGDHARPQSARELDRAERLNLGLELDPELLLDALTPGGHQRDDVRRRGAAEVLDEVRVLGAETGAADAQAATPGGVEQLARRAALRARIVGVLEGRAEGLDARGLRLLAPLAQVGERRLDLRLLSRLELELGARDDLAAASGSSAGS